jgi:hypothetical protein
MQQIRISTAGCVVGAMSGGAAAERHKRDPSTQWGGVRGVRGWRRQPQSECMTACK